MDSPYTNMLYASIAKQLEERDATIQDLAYDNARLLGERVNLNAEIRRLREELAKGMSEYLELSLGYPRTVARNEYLERENGNLMSLLLIRDEEMKALKDGLKDPLKERALKACIGIAQDYDHHEIVKETTSVKIAWTVGQNAMEKADDSIP